MRWHKQTDCPNVPDCDCPSPTELPEYLGQISVTPCGGSSSAASSSPSSEQPSSDEPSSEVPPSSDASSEVPGLCEEICSGTCTWTGTPEHYGYGGVIWGVAFGNEPANNCVNAPEPAPQACGCVFPERLPNFVGDTQVTDCGCCQRCQHVWQMYAWARWQYGPEPCQSWAPGQDCGGPCQVPGWTGEYGEVVIADCGETPVDPNGGGGSEGSSDSSVGGYY